MDAVLMIEVPAAEAVSLKAEGADGGGSTSGGSTPPTSEAQPQQLDSVQQQEQQHGVHFEPAVEQQQAGTSPGGVSADVSQAAKEAAEAGAAAATLDLSAGPAEVAAPPAAAPEVPAASESAEGPAVQASPAAPPAAAAGAAGQAQGSEAAAASAEGPAEEEDELAASLLSNMAAWQTELDTFQAVLRRCMESTPTPGAVPAGSPSTVDESGRGAARLLHSGPKGITGYRGVTQHKRTKRYEANVWMDHKQMYLGAFDVPEQAAHAHDIGALCSGKARTEALNFPMTDYEALLPMLYSLPHAQVVAALRGYGRLPTARPPGGISSGRLLSSPSARSVSAKEETEDEEYEEGAAVPSQRPRRTRKVSASPGGSRGLPPLPPLPPSEPMDWQAALQLSAHQQQGLGPQVKQEGGQSASSGQQQRAGGAPAAAAAGVNGLAVAAAQGMKGEPPSPASLALAQQAQLQALSAALMGGARAPSAMSGAAAPMAAAAGSEGRPPVPRPPAKAAGSRGGGQEADDGSAVSLFEGVLWRIMAQSHQLARPEEVGMDGSGAPRPLHSGPKGQSGFKGVTLYKRCQRYNAHIWLGKQTHIGTFHTAEQAAVAHDVMELWRNEHAQGLNFGVEAYGELLPTLKALSEADALASLRNYSRSPSAAAAAAASGITNLGASQRSSKQKQGGGGGGSRPSSAAAAPPAAAAATAATQPPAQHMPSLRRRQRKPQHMPGGGAPVEAEESSGGSVPAQRQSAGSLMWYMLEQEKSVEDDYEEMSDPDFSPAEAAVQGGKRQRCGSESPPNEPLGFHPRSSASIARALAAEVLPSFPIVGARPPRAGSSHRWGVAVSLRGQAAWFGRLDRQRAAVAADLSLLWRRISSSGAADEDEKDTGAPFNVPEAGYEQDGVLMEQIRRIKTAQQLCQFLASVIPQDPPAPTGGAAAAAAAAAAVLAGQRMQEPPLLPPPVAVAPAAAAGSAGTASGSRKRKQQTLLEEARASKLHALASSGSGAGSPRPAVVPGGAVAAISTSRLAASSSAALAGVPAANGQQQQQAVQQQDEQQPVEGKLAQAAAAVQQADVADSASMLSALRLLVTAGKGGALLQEVVAGWESYPLMQQQDLFGALQLPVSSGDWEQLQERLQVALDLASLF